MAKEFLLFNLKEGYESLGKLIKEIEDDKEFFAKDIVCHHSWIHDIYSHLNMAWNAREATEEETEECSDQNYAKWVQFPKDIELG